MKKSFGETFLDFLKLDSDYLPRDFSSIYELFDYLDEALEQEEKINKCIDESEASDAIPLKAKGRLRKQFLSELKYLKSDIDSVLNYLTNFTTFDSLDLLPFLVQYLSITEGENFGLMSDIDKYRDLDAEVINLKPVKFKGITYYIITTLSNMERLERIRKQPVKSIDEYLDILDNDRYICIDKSSEYNILDGVLLEKDFEAFPKLLRLGYALIHIRLSHPEFTDKDLFANVLDVVSKKQKVTRAL